MIQDQVKLSLGVAVGVVVQGIRIRFGRSLITITGVVLGIAFLMSNLAGQAIKDAVRDEEQMRTEVKRMENFLISEMGPPQERTIGVIQIGPISEVESRLIIQLAADGLRTCRWHNASPNQTIPMFSSVPLEKAMLNEVGGDTSAVLLLGKGPLPESFQTADDIASLFTGALGKVLAMTQNDAVIPDTPSLSVVSLARELSPEELAALQRTKDTARFRSFWIILISLVVTVAGIANAMLMSVTERFREIGTMKCLGALSGFIRWIFFVESSFMGAVGGLVGTCLGTGASILVYGFVYGFGPVLAATDFMRLAGYMLLSVIAGIALSVLAAIYPASVAAAMVPANALRTNI